MALPGINVPNIDSASLQDIVLHLIQTISGTGMDKWMHRYETVRAINAYKKMRREERGIVDIIDEMPRGDDSVEAQWHLLWVVYFQ